MEMETTCDHPPGTFARPGVVRQGWYLVESARRLPAGRVRPVAIGPRRLVLYRDLDGRSHVVADRCPHLGSDLALAHVTRAGLRCRFHGWSTALDDLKLMESVEWTGAFAASDTTLERYAGFVERLPAW